MSRNFRSLSTLSRSLLRPRPSTLQHDGIVRTRRVRIVRPLFKSRRARLLSIPLVGVSIYVIAGSPLQDLLAEDESDDQLSTRVERVSGTQEIEKPERDGLEVQDEVDEDAWFIPLGWPRQWSPKYYKESDPETQIFLDFSKDGDRASRVKNQLAGYVGRRLAAHPRVNEKLGNQFRARKYWLNIDYPVGPPAEYECRGLEITNDYIAWITRPVDPADVSRLHRFLWPKSIFLSMWASYSTLLQMQLAKVKSRFNVKPNEARRSPPGYSKLPLSQYTKHEEATEPFAEPKSPLPVELPGTAPASPSVSENLDRALTLGPLRFPIPIPKPSADITAAADVFKQTLAETSKPDPLILPRGAVLVSGLVEVVGSKFLFIMAVEAAYSPADSEWTTISIECKRVQLRNPNP